MLELLVVLAIIATLSAIGIGGLTVLRTTVLLNQATNELVSLLRLGQARARNGAVSEMRFIATNSIPASRVDGFAFYFDSATTFSARYCYASGSTGSINYNCSGVEATMSAAVLIPNGLNEITVQPVDISVCRGVVISRLNSDWAGISGPTSAARQTGTCVIRITHLQLGQSRDISINLGENSIEVL